MTNGVATTHWISFFLFDEFSLESFSSCLSALRLANEVLKRQSYCWRVVTLAGGPVVSSSGVEISTSSSIEAERERFANLPWPETVIVCGGQVRLPRARAVETWLRECRFRQTQIVAFEGATHFLAQAGFLNGLRCAVHWEQFPAFSEEFPSIKPRQTLFETDGGISTVAGGEVAFDMCLTLVEKDFGSDVVEKVCDRALSARSRSPGESQRIPFRSRYGIKHPGLIKVIQVMVNNADAALPLDSVVSSTGLSRRQIERLFRKEIGQSPYRYYLELRLERADLLLKHSSLSMVEIAVACGFQAGSNFSKSYRATYGVSPQARRLALLDAERQKRQSFREVGLVLAATSSYPEPLLCVQ